MEEVAGLDNELPIVRDAELGKAKVISGLGVSVEYVLPVPPPLPLLPPPQATKNAHKSGLNQKYNALDECMFTNIFHG